MNPLVWALAGFVAGAIAGSFLATLIMRWPAGLSVVSGRSRCDACRRPLGPAELVPLLSAGWRRGRCRTCGAPIDRLHMRVEMACAAIGALALWLVPAPSGILWAGIGWLLLTLAVLDWRHFWLPDALTLPLALLGLTLGGWVTGLPLADRAIGAAAGYGALLALALAYRALRGREGLGLGDAKLLGALGAWFGWRALPFILLAAAGAGLAIVLAARLAGRRVDATTSLPFGTLLALAALPGWLLASA